MADLTFISFISSVIGGLVAAGITHVLNNRHALLMKRELYREVLYREKVPVYNEVYELASGFIHDYEFFVGGSSDKSIEAIDRAVFIKKKINDSGLLMPGKVLDAIGACDEICEHLMEQPSLSKERFQLNSEPTEDLLVIRTFADQLKSVIKILRDDLGVEVLTADLGKFFRTASLKPGLSERVEKFIEKIGRKTICNNKGSEVKDET